MKIWAPLILVCFQMATCYAAGAEGLYPFHGRVDVVDGIWECSVQTPTGRVDVKANRTSDGSYQSTIDVQNIHTPFFDMTTRLTGVVRPDKSVTGESVFSGDFESQHTLFNGRAGPEVSARFEIGPDALRLSDISWGGLKALGTIGFDAPYPVDARVQLYELDLIDALGLIAGQHKEWTGNGAISGDVRLWGTVGKLSLKADLVSQNGSIEALSYDLLSLNLQGIYPMIDLAGSTVTKTNGFSVGLAGLIDLSDRANMDAQFKTIQRIPLVQNNVQHAEWVLKKVQDPEGDGKTQTTFFLKQNKTNASTGQEDSSLLGVQKKIGF